MIRLLIALEMLVTGASPAAAWPCPHGQLYRVHLGRCVGLGTALARPYEGRRMLMSRARPDRSWYVEFAFPQTITLTDDEARAAAIEKLKDLR